MASLVEVARRANVAPSVVSRLLNNDPTLRIRRETQERIERAVKELGYTPNHAGRALRSARNGALGLIVPDVTNPLYGEILRGAEDRARDDGYLVLLGNATDLSHHEGPYKRMVAEGRIDGVLLQRNNVIDDATLLRLTDTRVPTVLINSHVEGVPGSVILDDEAGARVATAHLIALGHERIGHLSGPAVTDTAMRRRHGFELALSSAGLRYRPEWIIEAGYDAAGGYAAMQCLLAHEPRPTAVFVATIAAALGALIAAREAGVRIPRDLSVVAFHEAWIARHTWPPLTTVQLPLYKLGWQATTTLLMCLNGAKPADVVVHDPRPLLIQRSSTAPID